MNEVLRIENLSKSFGRKNVLQDFSMSIEKGKVYGLLGKNGEGKTTLIRVIMGVIPPDRGDLFYKSQKIKFNDTSYKKEIGYIPEESIFFSWMTIKELLNFNASFFPTWNAKKADEYLARFSLEKKTRIKNLSRGMKLKLGLMVALASEPEFLILDDPTSGLDVPTRQDFLKGVIEEILEGGTTILFSSHLVHELEGIIDHLSILHEGRLILDKNFEEVKSSVKRVRLTFDKNIPEKIELEGIITERKDGAYEELVVYPWNEEKRERLQALRPVSMEVESLTLEEIFVSFVS